MSKLLDQVREFHTAAGQPVLAEPTVPDIERVRLRLRLVAEEFQELLVAAGCPEQNTERVFTDVRALFECFKLDVDLVEFVDALCDIQYVVAGTFLECGVDDESCLDNVHASNMSKFPTTVDAMGKIKKGPHYWPPRLDKILVGQKILNDFQTKRAEAAAMSDDAYKTMVGCGGRCL